MKRLLYLSLIGGLMSCHSTNMQKPVLNQNSKTNISDRTNLKIRGQYENEQTRKEIKSESKTFKIPVLELEKLDRDDLEIRVWRFAAFDEKNIVLVIKRQKGTWNAHIVIQTILEKHAGEPNPPHKLSRNKMHPPKSGWKELWKSLRNEDILTLPDGDFVGNEVCNDCWVFVFETRYDNEYRVFDYHAPETHLSLREARQVNKIIETLSSEFNTNIFDRKSFVSP